MLGNNVDTSWAARQVFQSRGALVYKSAFAWRAGRNFEQRMLREPRSGGPPPLVQGLVGLGFLPADQPIPVRHLAYPGELAGGEGAGRQPVSSREAEEQGQRLVLQHMLQGGPPAVYCQVTLPLQFLGHPLQVRPDALVWTGDRWVVVEIKSRLLGAYEGPPPQQLLLRARRQAAVYLLAVERTWDQRRQLAPRWGIRDPEGGWGPDLQLLEGPPGLLDTRVVLVLRWMRQPGWAMQVHQAQGDYASLLAFEGRRPSEIAGAELAPAPPAANRPRLGERDLRELRDWIEMLPHRLSSECLNTACPLLPVCLSSSEQVQDPAAVLVSAGDLHLPPELGVPQLLAHIEGGDPGGPPLPPLVRQWLRAGWEIADRAVQEAGVPRHTD